jgi:hypothetical protein
MSVLNALNSAVYARLSGNAALTTELGGTAIYYQLAPDDALLPYVIWSYQFGPNEPHRTAHRDPEAQIWIRAYAASAKRAGIVDLAVDTALRTNPPAVTGYNNWWFARNESRSDVEIDDAQVKTYMAGAIWELRLDHQ